MPCPAERLLPALDSLCGRRIQFFRRRLRTRFLLLRPHRLRPTWPTRRCSAEKGEALLSKIQTYAKEGGSQEDFNRDDTALVDYLYTVATMRELIDLQCASDPTDEQAAEESLYTSQLYRELNEGYWDAMHALSVTGHGKLLKEHYDAQQIQWFISYDAQSAEEALYARRTRCASATAC